MPKETEKEYFPRLRSFVSIFRKTDEQMRIKRKDRDEKIYHKTQWIRLFNSQNYQFFLLLKKYESINSWRNVEDPVMLRNCRNIQIYFKKTYVPLFTEQTKNQQTQLKINECLYPIFSKQLKAHLRKNNIQ